MRAKILLLLLILVACPECARAFLYSSRTSGSMPSKAAKENAKENAIPTGQDRKMPSPLWHHHRMPLWACRLLYGLTSVNPLLSVLINQYTGIRNFRPVMVVHSAQENKDPLPKQIYRQIFYFARLRPRLLFAIGACARGLQQTTVLQLVFDPRLGVGFGLNMLALITNAQWPAPLVLGWACSKSSWRYLHAEPPVPTQDINFPIQINGLGSIGSRRGR